MAKIEVQRTHTIEDPVVHVSVNLATREVRLKFEHTCEKCSGYGCRAGCHNVYPIANFDELEKHVGPAAVATLREVIREKLGQ